MPKFLHAADVHLDSPMLGLSDLEGESVAVFETATRCAFDNLTRLAREQRVDFVLLAGDLYDGDCRDYRACLFLRNGLGQLNCPVFLISGNHDAANLMTKRLSWPANVKLLSADQPESVFLKDLGVAIHGQGFAQREVTHDLTDSYPRAAANYFNIGLLHTSLAGRPGHDNYAPTTPDRLKRLGYDYWALGHIHKREIIDGDPIIVYPGNLQGRHVRETGPKGCVIVTTAGNTKPRVEFHALDVARWAVCDVDVTQATSLSDVLDLARAALGRVHRASEGRPTAVRCQFVGPCPIHNQLLANTYKLRNEFLQIARSTARDDLCVEEVRVRTRPTTDAADLAGPLAAIRAIVTEFAASTNLAGELSQLFADLEAKLPRELIERQFALPWKDEGDLHELLAEVAPLLCERLAVRDA